MLDSMRGLRMLMVFGLIAGSLGCEAQSPEVSSQAVKRFERERARSKMIYVEAFYTRDKAAKLDIRKAAVAQGRVLFIPSKPPLDGVFEILNRRGKVIKAIAYKTGPLPPAPGQVSRIAFRIPPVIGAAAVRLSEPSRQLSATAEIR